MLHLSVISTKETLITFASIVLMASLLFLCTSAYAQTRQDTNSSSRPMTTTIPTAALPKNYPAIVPTPLSSSLRSKTHKIQQALLMPRAITKLPIPTVAAAKKLSRYSSTPLLIKLEIKNS